MEAILTGRREFYGLRKGKEAKMVKIVGLREGGWDAYGRTFWDATFLKRIFLELNLKTYTFF